MREGERHDLFDDEFFSKSQDFKLSTSGLSAGDRFFGTGFGAPDPDGYGINCGYRSDMIQMAQSLPLNICKLTLPHNTTNSADLAGADMIKFGIESKWSSKEASTHNFRTEIIKAMRDMRKMCEDGRSQSTTVSSKL